MKNPLTLAGIEPATSRFVVQHLNHCATAVPQCFRLENKFLYLEITYPLLIFVVSVLLLLLDVFEFIQSLGTAQWCVHFIRVIEQAVVNFIFPRLFLKGHERLETVAPEHFAGQVR